ncbi:MAG: hypothetical protein J7L86_07885 [Candidatus Marinimicrobia bacterium]|nr:hypothetical protein [Candidatus Neomarinimicrobiota bacterium]
MFKSFIQIWKKKDLSSQTLEKSLMTLEMDYQMYKEAVRSLRHCNDSDLCIDIYETDKQINKSERDIRKKVLTHLLMFDKAEIPAGLALASIVIDIERIGDYTKNIADLARLHPERLNGGKHENDLQNIEKRIDEFFQLTLEAFPESDIELARQVVKGYRKISKKCTLISISLIKGEGEFNVADAVTLGLYLRFLKRVAAHLFNICTSIVNPFHRIGFSEKKNEV